MPYVKSQFSDQKGKKGGGGANQLNTFANF